MSSPAAQMTCVKKLRRALFASRSTNGESGGGVDHVVKRVVRVHPVATSAPSWVPSRARRRSSSVSSLKRCSAASSAARSSAVDLRRRQLGREALELRPHEERLAQLVARQRADANAAVGTNETSPSAASRRSASRTGVRLTWYCSESCSWRSTVPARSRLRRSPPRARARCRRPWCRPAAMPAESRTLARRRRRPRTCSRRAHRHERQVALGDPVLDRVRQLRPRRSPRPRRQVPWSSTSAPSSRRARRAPPSSPGRRSLWSAQRSTSYRLLWSVVELRLFGRAFQRERRALAAGDGLEHRSK